MKTTLYPWLPMALILVLAVTAGPASAAPTAPTPFEQACRALTDHGGPAGERLRELFAATWAYRMREYPEAATYSGYPGQNDRWTDLSAEAIARRRRELQAPLAALLTIPREELTAEERLSYDLFRRNCEEAIAAARFPKELLQITQLDGAHLAVAQMVRAMPKSTLKDGRDIVARLQALGTLVDQTITLLEKGLAAGITPPRIALRDVVGQLEGQLVADPATSPILAPLQDTPASLPPAEWQRIRDDAAEAVRTVVLPAFERLRDFLATRYIPGAREAIALAALPDGAEWYAFTVRSHTTTDLTPGEIHRIGLAEVRRLRGEMERLIGESGFAGSPEAFFRFLRSDPQFYHPDAASLLDGYRDICRRADGEAGKLFGRLPRLPYEVTEVPAFAAKSLPVAYYQPGSTRAGRPGRFYINTSNLASRPRWEMEALALHEAVPGHHLQIALADELQGVPEFRKYGHYTAYVEGWGLYAESLGYEMGFYRDRYAAFGQLAFELWRAVRLVVDTGMHALGWSRRQAIDYFLAQTGKTTHDATVEIDRYIVWPGQALTYKIGEMRIKALRRTAAAALGERFDLRAFHDEVLRRGALPLDLLEEKIGEWIAGQRK